MAYYLTHNALKRTALTTVMLALWSWGAWATHIVGGQFTYKLLNSQTSEYKITLDIYFDCFRGNPQAIISDTVAHIAIYNAANNNLISTLDLRRKEPGTRINKANYNCVIQPTSECVRHYRYERTLIIDPGQNGVVLTYQRCCRNNSINNIVSPGATGATFWTVIPPKALNNSSAIFKSLPPNFVCVNAPLQFDHSATDVDGDSLVYFLSDVYTGASQAVPQPDIPAAPPYLKVNWSGSYSVTNQLIGDPGLTINRQTGELNVTPTRTGQFVVGIGVMEYRQGQLINIAYRDFQLNVINCEFNLLADFTVKGNVPEGDGFVFECRDTVFFKDRSLKAATWEWDFGDPTTEDDTSTQREPYWVYPGNGDYRVTLKVTNEICEDDYSFTIKIRSTRPFDLPSPKILCDKPETWLDTKTPDATSVLWSNGDKGQRIYVTDTGTYMVEVSYNQCVYRDTTEVLWFPVMLDLPEDTLICGTVDDVQLDAGGNATSYAWSTGVNDTFRTTTVNTPGIYKVVGSNRYCSKQEEIRVWSTSEAKVDDAFYCNEFIHQVEVDSFEEASYRWSTGETGRSISILKGGNYWVDVIQRHCVTRTEFKVDNSVVLLDLGEDQHFCDVVNLVLDAGPHMRRYDWSTDQTSRTIRAQMEGLYWVAVTDSFGCERSDSIRLTMSISPELELGYDTSICVRAPVVLGPEQEASIVRYVWSTGEDSRTIETETQGNYMLTITDGFGCTAADSIFVFVDPLALPNDLYVPNAFTPNGDGLNDVFPFDRYIQQTAYFVVIYTRWGEKVFDSRTGPTQFWDGNYKGKKAPAETYLYHVEYYGCDGMLRQVNGTVHNLY